MNILNEFKHFIGKAKKGLIGILVAVSVFSVKVCDEVSQNVPKSVVELSNTVAVASRDVVLLGISNISNLKQAYELLKSSDNNEDISKVYYKGLSIAISKKNYCEEVRKWRKQCLDLWKSDKSTYHSLNTTRGRFVPEELIKYRFFNDNILNPLLFDRQHSVDLPTLWKELQLGNFKEWYDPIEEKFRERNEIINKMTEEINKSNDHKIMQRDVAELAWESYLTKKLVDDYHIDVSDYDLKKIEKIFFENLSCVVRNIVIKYRNTKPKYRMKADLMFEAKAYCESVDCVDEGPSLVEIFKVKHTKEDLFLY